MFYRFKNIFCSMKCYHMSIEWWLIMNLIFFSYPIWHPQQINILSHHKLLFYFFLFCKQAQNILNTFTYSLVTTHKSLCFLLTPNYYCKHNIYHRVFLYIYLEYLACYYENKCICCIFFVTFFPHPLILISEIHNIATFNMQ